MHTILIIDDDTELTEMLSDYLHAADYEVLVAHNGEEGLAVLGRNPNISLILLDVMMPVMDGFETLKALRKHYLTPVLMLTARGDDYDRILGLELGADDYLPKPFNHRELLARVKVIIRRLDLTTGLSETAQHPTVNGIQLDVKQQSASLNAQPLPLTGTEFYVLQLLMQNAGQIVTKATISERALGKKLMAFDRNIDMHVSNIRRKMAEISDDTKIKTIRGAGYILLEA